MLKEELDIVNVFRKDLFLADSIRGLMKKSGNKSYGRIFDTSQELIKQEVLSMQKQGKSTVCSLNISNYKCQNYLSMLEFIDADTKLKEEEKRAINSLVEAIPNKYFTLLLSPQRSDGKAPKKEAYDLSFIVDDECDSVKLLNILNNHLKMNKLDLNLLVYKTKEFYELILSRENNVAKELIRNHIVVYGALSYYRILKEAIEHGFKM